MWYKLEIISNNPCEHVNDAAKAPLTAAPWQVPIAPNSDCDCLTWIVSPNKFFFPYAAYYSTSSAIGDEGVIGNMHEKLMNLWQA